MSDVEKRDRGMMRVDVRRVQGMRAVRGSVPAQGDRA